MTCIVCWKDGWLAWWVSKVNVLDSCTTGGWGEPKGRHSPWFWVPTAKQTPGAVAVDLKKGGCQRPKTSQKGGCQRGSSCWAVVVSLASPRKASCISYN